MDEIAVVKCVRCGRDWTPFESGFSTCPACRIPCADPKHAGCSRFNTVYNNPWEDVHKPIQSLVGRIGPGARDNITKAYEER